MTERQAAILKFIEGYWTAHAMSPSIRDIQAGAGVSSTSVVSYNLVRMEQAGLIRLAASALTSKGTPRLGGVRVIRPVQRRGSRCVLCGCPSTGSGCTEGGDA